MKYLILGIALFTATTSFANEISESKCLVAYNYSTDMIVLTNVMQGYEESIQNVNCLDLAKNAKNSRINGKRVTGVEVIYINPKSTND